MFKMISVQPQYLQPGMVLARDVESDDALLLSRGIKLTKHMIVKLVNNHTDEVWICDNRKTENLKTYQENMDHFDSLVKALRTQETFAMGEVEQILNNFSKASSQSSLLKYIHGIRKADQYTYQHSLNVCYLAMMLGNWSGYSNGKMVALAGLLHDLGKTMINNDILNKPDALDDEEWKVMRQHPQLGYELLVKAEEIPAEVLSGVLFHHERMDGHGYPQRLSGDQIPKIARIVAIVDVFDALTSDRVYRGKQDVFEVLQFMHDRYQEFDLTYLRIFTENMLEILVGEEVLLSNNQVGKIVFNNPYRDFSPLIQTEDGFIDLSENREITIERVFS